MTSDAIRQPDSTRPTAEPSAPGASEEVVAAAGEPEPTPAESSAADGAAPTTGTATGETESVAQAATAETIGATEAVASTEAVTTAEAVAATQAASAEATTVPGPARRERFVTVMRRFVTFAMTVGLFVGGIALGSTIFQQTRPAPAVVPVGQVGTSAQQPPAVTREFVAALEANNFDALRSALQRDPHIALTDELQRFGIQKIENIEVLGTHVAESRSATEILMQFKNEEGIPLAVNLVVLVDGGKIEGFR